MELSIDTSTQTASVAISSKGEVFTELTWNAGRNHTAELVPSLICLMKRAKLALNDIHGIIVAKGPGSFNGLRVGMSIAKGLGFALQIPLVGISTLEVEAFPHAASTIPVCPIMDAGRNEIATALFRVNNGGWQCLIEEHIDTVDGLLSNIRERTVFCGSLPTDVKDQLREGLGNKMLLIQGSANIRRSGYLAELGWKRLYTGDSDSIKSLQPFYLKKPAITLSQRRSGI